MIDFHSHILPGIDDGAENSLISLKMLGTSMESGVTTVIATPHCYIHDGDTIENFLYQREYAYQRLKSAAADQGKTLPRIVLGAEVLLVRNLHKEHDLAKLCIEGTNYILIEMPYEPWNDWMYEELYRITLKGYRPIMAHLDRFLSQEKLFSNLFSLDVIFQINASAFIEKTTRGKVLDFFSNDAAHVIGSDMHNTSTRPPNIKEAYDIIKAKFGVNYADFLTVNSERILENNSAYPAIFKRPGFFKKLFI